MINKQTLGFYSWFERPGITLFLFTFLVLLIRVFLRGQQLELDEAEQVVMAQQLSLGYPDQPPLYSWLQYVFFHLLGCNLISLALLKSFLLFGCLYSFHQICRLHCQSIALAWCATFAWILIPAISLDLIKDNTHSLLALFAVCLTWYWLIAPSQLNKLLWYLVLGCFIGIGLISKFNYLLFLGILLISSSFFTEYRNKLVNPYMLFALTIGLLIASPYIFWLQHHFSLGFRSVYKLIPEDKPQWHGFIELIIACGFFIIPLFSVSGIFFPIKFRLKQQTALNSLLLSYHLSSLPFLMVLISLAAMRNFETRWLIPILFLSPLLFFGQVKAEDALANRVKLFLIVCLVVQLCFFIALLYRSHNGNKLRNQFPFQQIVQTIKKEHPQPDYIVSDSHWIIGNLMLYFPSSKGWLLHPANQPKLPRGYSLLIWQSPSPPFWIDYFALTTGIGQFEFIEEPRHHKVIVGYSFTENKTR